MTSKTDCNEKSASLLRIGSNLKKSANQRSKKKVSLRKISYS